MMAKSVSAAFDLFMRDVVRLDSSRSELATKSKNNLITEIEKFPTDGKFLDLYPSYTCIDFGSFSRKTKIRPLDDIDLMIVLHAQGGWREEINGGYRVRVQSGVSKQLSLCNPGTDILNSIKVINKFKEYLISVPSYKKAEIKRNQEAVTLELSSYEWVYDIVPCFETSPDNFGRTFFLIPDGSGNWKPTDPRIDKARVVDINSKHRVSVIDMIRLVKYWAKRRTAATMGSYFLECIILSYYSSLKEGSSGSVNVELTNLFAYVYHQIDISLNDPKGFQGNLNSLDAEERSSIRERAKLDYHRSKQANELEKNGSQKEAIEKWGEVFGPDFPKYIY